VICGDCNMEDSTILFIRADASSEIGTGHVMRCMALGQAWGEFRANDNKKLSLTKKQSVVFICAEIPEKLERQLPEEGFGVIRIAVEPGSVRDAEDTLRIMMEFVGRVKGRNPISDREHLMPDSWLILDGYQFKANYHHRIRESGRKLLVIDDYNHLAEYDCDILLNQNLGSEELVYKTSQDTKQLLGSKYVLLRREFCEAGCKRRGGDKYPIIGNKILVTMGGADTHNITLKILEIINRIDMSPLHIRVLVGMANPWRETLVSLFEDTQHQIEILSSAYNMPAQMLWADLVITAAGSTCWELLYLDVPFGMIVVAENQGGIALALEQRRIAASFGEPDTLNGDAIKEWLKRMLTHLRARRSGCIVVDSFGVDRVINRLARTGEGVISRDSLSLRRATMNDVDILFSWANEMETRKNSFHTAYISRSEHIEWLENKLQSNKDLLFMGEIDSIPIGQIRYEKSTNLESVIGIFIAPRYRGMGMAAKLLLETVTVAANELDVCRHRAVVHEANYSSAHLFECAGFVLRRKLNVGGVECREYEWNMN